MVTGSRTSGNRGVGLDDEAKKMIQSIKEVVDSHSDADIYTALKEANMDANEAVEKLIHQDPFHEVKRKRDRKKEDTVFVEPANIKKPLENVTSEVKVRTQPEHNVRRGGYSRNFFPRNAAQRNASPRNPATGSNKEFRVVRDNRSNPNVDEELKHSSAQSSGSNINKVVATVNKLGSRGGLGNRNSSGAQDSTDECNAPADARLRQAEIRPLHCPVNKELGGVTLPSTNSVLGVYSSSKDPVHVPSPVSRSSPVGAIKREVRGGGLGGKPSENVGKDPSVPSFSGSSIRKNGPPNAHRPSSPTSKIDHSRTTARESVMPSGVEKNRSYLNRQRGNRGSQYARTQQVGGHTKGASQNKEWKPKSNQKPVGHNPGVIGTPTKSQARRPADNSINVETEAVKLQNKLSHVHISESQNVIIADHIRVSETDRCQLTFGSFVQEFNSSRNSESAFEESHSSEEVRESDRSSPVTCPEASADGPGVLPITIDDHVRVSRSDSPVSAVSEPQLPEQKETHRSDNLDAYSGIELLNRNGPPYTPLEFEQQQDPPELQKFSQAYDNHGSYEFPYFSPAMDETVRVQGLPSPHEQGLSAHMLNNAPPSTIPMLQQQQQASMQQMYPQVHVSHFPNLMPYRQFLSPVYVPQMPMPGYSGNPAAYAHPSNGNSYVLMPGGGSHLGSNGVKYGIHQQYKPVPTGGPAGFGTYNNPNGYPTNPPNVVGNATGLEDPSRMINKHGNIYVPNPQAETSEIWMQNPRDLSSLQSPYYNVAGQSPHGAYLSSHTAHQSFNPTAQSSHMQFQGLFHPSQPGTMANPHHMGPGLSGNVGVGVVPSPPSQVGTYQQSQLGHPNWPSNF
ncbi:GBF-interacting protein 1 [Arabidopsis thaliana x Arabidopsis arenosa]|nr:GBF-interacting protein 1 [Arabidopsis thaliana x Arabidopsis arenosa]